MTKKPLLVMPLILLSGLFSLSAITSPAESRRAFDLSTPAHQMFWNNRIQRGYQGRYNAPPSVAPDYHTYQSLTGRAAMPTLPQFKSDYLDEVSVEGMYQWPREKFPLKVYIAPGTNVPGYRPIMGPAVREALDTWASVSNGKLAWMEVPNRAQADITVDWTANVTERTTGTEAGRTSTLTRLNTQTNRGIIYNAKTLFLTKLPNRLFGDQEFKKTALHEIGHALGLQGHSSSRTDIMYYAVSPSQRPELTARDVATLNSLYAGYPVLNEIATFKQKQNTMGAVENKFDQ